MFYFYNHKDILSVIVWLLEWPKNEVYLILIDIFIGAITMALLENLVAGNIYIVKISASNEVGEGPFSNSVELAVLPKESPESNQRPKRLDSADAKGLYPATTIVFLRERKNTYFFSSSPLLCFHFYHVISLNLYLAPWMVTGEALMLWGWMALAAVLEVDTLTSEFTTVFNYCLPSYSS